MADRTTKALLEYFVDQINEAKKTTEDDRYVLDYTAGGVLFMRKKNGGRFPIGTRMTKGQMETCLRFYLRGATDT